MGEAAAHFTDVETKPREGKQTAQSHTSDRGRPGLSDTTGMLINIGALDSAWGAGRTPPTPPSSQLTSPALDRTLVFILCKVLGKHSFRLPSPSNQPLPPVSDLASHTLSRINIHNCVYTFCHNLHLLEEWGPVNCKL